MNRHSVHIEPVERRILLAAPAVIPPTALLYVGEDSGGVRIHTILPDGTDDTFIPTTAPNIVSAAMNPAHTRIVFVAQSDVDTLNSQEIFAVNADGSNETQLTNNISQDQEPQFSPDGSKIVFVSNRDGNDEIYVMNADGTNQTRLTNNSSKDEEPTFSPDGTKILFLSNQVGGAFHLFTIDAANGQNLTQLTGAGVGDDGPAYSADGRRIAFVSNRNGAADVYVMSSTGELADGASPATKITSIDANSEDVQHPTFSPDGIRIAFVFDGQNGSFLRTVNARDGSAFDDPKTGTLFESLQWSSAPQFANINNLTLKVTGTAGDDNITLSHTALTLTVTLNGQGETFDLDQFQGVEIYAGAGNDVIDGSQGAIAFYASGDAGNDHMIGGPEGDTLTGGAGRNTLFGGDGNDRLNGSGGRDFIYGEAGNDRCYGNGGNDYMVGGAGVDRMWGGDGDDLISGNSGNDKLFGEAGNDQLLGGDGNDIVYGGFGIDTLNGQKGTDSCDGDDADQLISIEVHP